MSVRPVGNRYEIVCRGKRFRASLIAGMENIPACIKELSDDEAEEYAITENLQRKDGFSFGRGRSLFQVGIRRKI